MKPTTAGPVRPCIFSSRTQRGSSLMLMLVVTGLISVGLFVLTQFVLLQKRQIEKNLSTTNIHLALHSLLDYTLFGLKQRWCINESLLPDDKCDLNHDASVERLLMSAEQEQSVRLMAASGSFTGSLPAGAIRVPLIERHARIENFTQKHPLWNLALGLKDSRINGIYIRIERETSTALPSSGGRTFLRLTAALTDGSSTKPLQIGGFDLIAHSFAGVYPRELSSFALIVPGSLHMDLPNRGASDPGDVALHKFSSRAEFGGQTGLIFQSPVFVNRDIYLPVGTGATAPYSPVTFAERVYMGDGRVFEGGLPFIPKQAGSLNQPWTDHPGFGGFLKGIENDGARDLGLDYLSGQTPGANVTGSMMQQCVQRNLTRADRNFIRNSYLQSQTQALSGSAGQYRLGLSQDNEFVEQVITNLNPRLDRWDGSASIKLRTDSKKPVIMAQVEWNGGKVSAPLPRDSDVTIQFDVSRDISREISRLREVQRQIEIVERKIAEANNGAQGGGGGGNGSSAQSGNGSQVDVAELNRQLDRLRREADQLNQVIADENQRRQNPPKMTISTTSASLQYQVQPHLLDLRVEIANAQSLSRNDALIGGLPTVKIQAFDSTYSRGTPISMNQINQGLAAYLNFELGSHGAILAPNGISFQRGTGSPVNTVVSTTNVAALDTTCNTESVGNSGQAFGSAAWSFSFANQARHSWNFAGDANQTVYHDPVKDQVVFSANNSVRGKAAFRVYSIVGNCIIQPDAQYVTGFFTCDTLTVQPRTQPLWIVGTVITSKLDIDPSAYRAGIYWSSIYGQQATALLRDLGELKPISGQGNCYVSQTHSPVWHPIPALPEVADRYSCNVVSLRAKADPFQWTAVDPDCGLLTPNAPSHTCKHRVLRYFVVEISRESSL